MMFRNGSESKSIFRKHLYLFILTILIPTTLLLAFQVYRVSRDAISQTESTSLVQLDRTARNLDMLLDELDHISLQISITPNILDLLTRPFDQSAYQYALVKDQLKSWMTSNSLFYSIYLDILQNRKVLTTNEGIYEESGFYDQALISRLQAGNATPSDPWVGIHRIEETQGVEVLTMARGIPPTQQTSLGLLVLNIRKDVFLNTLQTLHAGVPERMQVFDPQGVLVTDPIPGFDASLIAAKITPGSVHKEVLKLSGSKFMLVSEKLPSNGWTLMQLMPFESYNRQMEDAIKQAVIIYAIVLSAGIGLAYLFASMMYDPWRRLAKRLQGVTHEPSSNGRDAYAFVNNAIHDLIAVIRQNEPIVRDHLVHDLLHDHLAVDDADRRFRETGLRFVYPHFAVLVVTGEWMEESDPNLHQGLYLYSLTEETLRSSFTIAGTILDRLRFGFIINLEIGEFDSELQARLEDTCREIQIRARDRFLAGMSFCISGIRPLERLYESYEQVKRTLAYKAFMPSDIIFVEDNKESFTLQYPAVYQKLVLNAILAGDRELAEGYVSELFDRYLTTGGYPYPKLLQMIVMLMSHVLSSLVQEGFNIGPLMNEIDLLQLQHCHNRHELQALILKQISRVIAYLESSRERSDSYSELARQVILFIEQHYAGNISITDIAASLGISASHLSRVFKAEVGKGPLEFLTEYRLNMSKQLLKDKTKPLQQISKLVGYNDVHTFIRSFKKNEGTTPGEYRKRAMDHS